MAGLFRTRPPVIRELALQFLVHVLVFFFYTIDRRNPGIEESEVALFLNLSFLAFVVNYLLLPRFFYPKKYLRFTLLSLLALTFTVLVEELALERIYFPDTRATRFPGVFYTLLGILPVSTVLVGFKFALDAFRKQREVEELQTAVKESELLFLKSQINPHFLFNNLNNLYAYAIEQSPKTPEIILELSSVLRYMLYDCKAEYVPLPKEIEQLENFTRLSELQIGERGQVSFRVSGLPQGFQIAPLLLVVFLENAFKHSTASQSSDIVIEVDIEVSEEGQLRFRCLNSFHHETNTDSLTGGIGLENVRKRLQLLYPDSHRLDIRKGEERFEVSLIMELDRMPLL